MSLGRNMLSDFKPKASETAAVLIETGARREKVKEVTLQLRIEEDKLLLFKEICQKRCPAKSRRGAMSVALRRFIDEAIAADGAILNFEE